MSRGRLAVLVLSAAALSPIAWWLGSPLFIDKETSEDLPAAAAAPATWTIEASGEFKGFDRIHWAMGTARIHRASTGQSLLRFEEGFHSANGPALHVYLVRSSKVARSSDVSKAGFIDLGPLKGNKGTQNYEIPGGVDLGDYQSVVIWCRPFGVAFAAASLVPR